jgi:YidC/Oxa1 family membrane protein insertase
MFELIAQAFAKLFDLTNSYGMAIILLTVCLRLLLLPLTLKQTRSMQGMAKLQPEIKKLQEKHNGDKQAMNAEVMALYKEHKVNPAGGCLPVLLQAPIFIGLYRVVNGLTKNRELSGMMIRVAKPQYLSENTELYRKLVASGGAMRSFGVDLAQSAQGITGSTAARLPYILLVVLVGITGYVQQVITNKQQGAPATAQAAQMQKTMKFLPVFFAFISFNIQAAVVLYWIAGNLWMIVQGQLLRKLNPVDPAIAAATAAAAAAPDKTEKPKAIVKSGSQDARPKSNSKSDAKPGRKSSGNGLGAPVARKTSPISSSTTNTSAPGKQSAIAAAKQAAREGRSRNQSKN